MDQSARRRRISPLVIEIAQYHDQPLMFLAENVPTGHLDIVKGNKCGTCRRRVGRFDRLSSHARTSLNEEYGQTLGSTAGNGEVVAEVSVCNPSAWISQSLISNSKIQMALTTEHVLFGSVDCPVSAIGRLYGRTPHARNIASG